MSHDPWHDDGNSQNHQADQNIKSDFPLAVPLRRYSPQHRGIPPILYFCGVFGKEWLEWKSERYTKGLMKTHKITMKNLQTTQLHEKIKLFFPWRHTIGGFPLKCARLAYSPKIQTKISPTKIWGPPGENFSHQKWPPGQCYKWKKKIHENQNEKITGG